MRRFRSDPHPYAAIPDGKAYIAEQWFVSLILRFFGMIYALFYDEYQCHFEKWLKSRTI
jgi:hypothetical protein